MVCCMHSFLAGGGEATVGGSCFLAESATADVHCCFDNLFVDVG